MRREAATWLPPWGPFSTPFGGLLIHPFDAAPSFPAMRREAATWLPLWGPFSTPFGGLLIPSPPAVFDFVASYPQLSGVEIG